MDDLSRRITRLLDEFERENRIWTEAEREKYRELEWEYSALFAEVDLVREVRQLRRLLEL
jgi:hypothetical protein